MRISNSCLFLVVLSIVFIGCTLQQDSEAKGVTKSGAFVDSVLVFSEDGSDVVLVYLATSRLSRSTAMELLNAHAIWNKKNESKEMCVRIMLQDSVSGQLWLNSSEMEKLQDSMASIVLEYSTPEELVDLETVFNVMKDMYKGMEFKDKTVHDVCRNFVLNCKNMKNVKSVGEYFVYAITCEYPGFKVNTAITRRIWSGCGKDTMEIVLSDSASTARYMKYVFPGL